MTTVIIIAAVLIVIILFFPVKKKNKKKSGNGTGAWDNTPSIRFAQFADYIRRKIKDLIGG